MRGRRGRKIKRRREEILSSPSQNYLDP